MSDAEILHRHAAIHAEMKMLRGMLNAAVDIAEWVWLTTIFCKLIDETLALQNERIPQQLQL